MAAHNLRESLREVASLSQLMTENGDGRLDSEAGALLERIREGTATMQSLLTDMVDYSTAVNSEHLSSRVDMEAALRQALLATDKQITACRVIVTHDPLAAVRGDSEILTKVLQHLIRNAIEYGGPTAPRIHISSERSDEGCQFSVSDNGPGIDPAFRSRIFKPFKRLHGKEFPGNGLGLAFCKKAVECHGGRMWMEPAPGAGSTFYFTLPPAD